MWITHGDSSGLSLFLSVVAIIVATAAFAVPLGMELWRNNKKLSLSARTAGKVCEEDSVFLLFHVAVNNASWIPRTIHDFSYKLPGCNALGIEPEYDSDRSCYSYSIGGKKEHIPADEAPSYPIDIDPLHSRRLLCAVKISLDLNKDADCKKLKGLQFVRLQISALGEKKAGMLVGRTLCQCQIYIVNSFYCPK